MTTADGVSLGPPGPVRVVSDSNLRRECIEAALRAHGVAIATADQDPVAVVVSARTPVELAPAQVPVLAFTDRRRPADWFHPEVATAYLDVHADFDTIARAIGGGTAGTVVPPRSPSSAQPEGTAVLTPRERDVLTELVTGGDNDEIGGRLGISPNTVRTHVQNILPKLGVNSRVEAAARGLELGLGPAMRWSA